MQYEMPQSLLVFAVSLKPETPNFGTFAGVAHPLRNYLFFNFLPFNCVYAHNYLKFKLYKYLDIKKIEFGHFRVHNPLYAKITVSQKKCFKTQFLILYRSLFS